MRTLSVPHPADLSDPVRERVRRRSKELFGSSDRLEVAIAVLLQADRVVNATDLQWELRLAANRVRTQLLALTKAGFMTEGGQGENRKRMFVRIDEDPFWDFCLHWYARSIE